MGVCVTEWAPPVDASGGHAGWLATHPPAALRSQAERHARIPQPPAPSAGGRQPPLPARVPAAGQGERRGGAGGPCRWQLGSWQLAARHRTASAPCCELATLPSVCAPPCAQRLLSACGAAGRRPPGRARLDRCLTARPPPACLASTPAGLVRLCGRGRRAQLLPAAGPRRVGAPGALALRLGGLGVGPAGRPHGLPRGVDVATGQAMLVHRALRLFSAAAQHNQSLSCLLSFTRRCCWATTACPSRLPSRWRWWSTRRAWRSARG